MDQEEELEGRINFLLQLLSLGLRATIEKERAVPRGGKGEGLSDGWNGLLQVFIWTLE